MVFRTMTAKVVVAALPVVLTATVTAVAAPSNRPRAAAADSPSSVVEDYALPSSQVADILAAYNITVRRGDGYILPTDCGDTTLIRVKSRGRTDVCFQVTGASGWLTLEMPSVYLIFGGDHNLKATLTPSGGAGKTYDVPANLWQPVGESDTGVPAALVDLRTA
jgi:hypothetical protein